MTFTVDWYGSRTALGMTQREFSEALGVCQRSIRYYETGRQARRVTEKLLARLLTDAGHDPRHYGIDP